METHIIQAPLSSERFSTELTTRCRKKGYLALLADMF